MLRKTGNHLVIVGVFFKKCVFVSVHSFSYIALYFDFSSFLFGFFVVSPVPSLLFSPDQRPSDHTHSTEKCVSFTRLAFLDSFYSILVLLHKVICFAQLSRRRCHEVIMAQSLVYLELLSLCLPDFMVAFDFSCWFMGDVSVSLYTIK
jgi:hypothetical protein